MALTDAEKSARWRQAHPARARAVNLAHKERARTTIAELKAVAGCRRCGIKDPRVLDFHHKDGEEKVLAVSQMLNRASWDSILLEVRKCDVVCANCHRIEHAEAEAESQIATAGFYRAS